MKIEIQYMPPNWNQYIKLERGSKYGANSLKQKEKGIVKYFMKGKRYTGNYPIEITFRPHFSSRRQDLDNFRYKGLLDGLVSAGVIKNDNLMHIQKITLEPVIDGLNYVEVEIKELEKK